jgi:hypothetical protein
VIGKLGKLGKTILASEMTVSEMSLVVQHGAEDQWNWRVAGSACLLGGSSASRISSAGSPEATTERS